MAGDSAIRAIHVKSDLSDCDSLSVSTSDDSFASDSDCFVCVPKEPVVIRSINHQEATVQPVGLAIVKPKEWDTWSNQVLKPDKSITNDGIMELILKGHIQLSNNRQPVTILVNTGCRIP